MDKTIIFGIAAALMIAGQASAQDLRTSGYAAYQDLSNGNQRIAASLFKAQQVKHNGAFWSLDAIARQKQQCEGWGAVLGQMRQDGLINEPSIGRIIVGKGAP